MDRRKFLKDAALSAAGLALSHSLLAEESKPGAMISGAIPTDGKRAAVSTGVEDHLKVSGYVRECSHRIPVVAEVDVVVAGGGVAGVSAAVNAARQGASVLLIEKANFPGGLWTGGLVLPVLAMYGKGKSVAWDKASRGFCEEICDGLLQSGGAIDPLNPMADSEAAKHILDKSLLDAGITTLYNTTVCGVTMSRDRITSVLLDCNTGRIAVRCKAAVDATGDGLLIHYTGNPFESRRYHVSSSFRTGGYREGQLSEHIVPVPGMTYDTQGTWEAIDGLDVFKISRLQQEHRLTIWDRVQQKKKESGFEDVYLMEVAPTTGVRVTRILDSLYNVTLEDTMQWKEFDDVIGLGGSSEPFEYKGQRIKPEEHPIWQIPYRALVPKETRNLLVAGRCFGYDQGIAWEAREISTCMVTGHAAGIAAAMAARDGIHVRDIDIPALQSLLRASNARLEF